MNCSCFVCSIRLVLYYSSFTNAFAQFNCPHSRNPCRRPRIVLSRTRRSIALTLYILLAVLSGYESYVIFTKEKFVLFSVVTTTELFASTAGLARMLMDNINCKKMVTELQIMLCISEYISKFNIKNTEYSFKYKASIYGISATVMVCLLPLAYFFHDEVGYETYLRAFNRTTLAILITSSHMLYIYQISYYRLFLKWTFMQMERELHDRLSGLGNCKVIFNNDKFLTGTGESAFLRKMKKLRKLYMVIINSFRRIKKMANLSLITAALMYYLLLILLLFIAVIGVKGGVIFHIGHYMFLGKYLGYVMHLVAISCVCENIETLIKRMQTYLFKVTLKELSEEEAREVELLIHLLTWEPPFEDKDRKIFGKSLAPNIMVAVITNSMVALQLYFFFTK